MRLVSVVSNFGGSRNTCAKTSERLGEYIEPRYVVLHIGNGAAWCSLHEHGLVLRWEFKPDETERALSALEEECEP